MGDTWAPWVQAGAQTAQGAAGILFSRLGAKYDRRQQLETQRQMMGLQLAGNKDMMDYSYQKQMEMWENTNYGAQLQQMKNAGLSPGLMYGMKGGGGVTVGSPGAPGVTGGTAGYVDTMGQGIQLALARAQMGLIEAQTNKVKTEDKKIGGVDTTLGETTIASITQGIQNQKAQQRWTEIQTRIDEIKERIAYITENSAIETISSIAKSAMMEARMQEVRKEITEQTATDLIKTVHTQLIKLGLENALIEAQTETEKGKPAVQKAEIKLMDQQDLDIIRQGVQRWWDLEIKAGGQKTNENRQMHEQWVNDLSASMKLPVEVVEKVVQAVLLKNLLAPPTRTPVQGFTPQR